MVWKGAPCEGGVYRDRGLSLWDFGEQTFFLKGCVIQIVLSVADAIILAET